VRDVAGTRRLKRARPRGRDRLPFSLRQPVPALIVAALCLGALGVIGLGVEDRVKPTSLSVPGTESARANDMLREHFGDSAPFAILIEGPTSRVDEQGPALVRALRAEPGVTTLSPWDRGEGLERLRPSNQQALIIADFHVPIDEAVTETVPRLEQIVAREVEDPVAATSTGFATISRAIQEESIDATRRAELVAIPILLLVLLLVFRSPVAAAIPLAFGAATVLASRGVVSLLAGAIDVDAFALSCCSMMGLALGVDYALLMVSRFREELAAGKSPLDAAATTRGTAGRTAVFAGSTLFISMLISVFMLPGSLLVSLAGTVVIVTLLAVITASVVGPPLLMVLGDRVNLWTIGSAERRERRLMAIVGGALARPRFVAVAIGLLMLALAAPALGLNTGPPSTEQLPSDDPARQDAEAIEAAIGPGWGAPFIVVAETDSGSITDPKRLEALATWQQKIAEEEGVRAVIGPGQIAARARPLRELRGQVFGEGDEPGLDRLGRDLERAADGVALLREGVARAGAGAELLAAGAGDAQRGSEQVLAGISQARAGSARAESALSDFAAATRQLAKGEERALLATLAIKFGVGDLRRNLRRNTSEQARRLDERLPALSGEAGELEGFAADAQQGLEEAESQLEQMTVGQADPRYAAALAEVRAALAAVSGTDPVTATPIAPGYDGLAAELQSMSEELDGLADDADRVDGWLGSADSALGRLHGVALRLNEGTRELRRGSKELAAGAQRLADEAPQLGDGIFELSGGVARLADGLGQLRSGTDELARGLADGLARSLPLERGMERAEARFSSTAPDLRRLRRDSPGIFDSSYFVLSALDGAAPQQRELAARAVDLDGGGQAALILAIPRYGFNTEGSADLNDRLIEDARGLARDAEVDTAVAGGAAQLTDYDRVTTTRIPLVIAAITIVTFLALVWILRALPLAAIAVGLNLVTVGAAFGVLTALNAVPEGWPLGGRTYIDAIGAAAIFGVVFGLSIDYAVFLLVRMRESWDAGAGHLAAIEHGLERTAAVVTGAAAIMAAVFIAFAWAPIATVSQLGVGLTVAVILDATVIRLLLLPVLMRLAGERVWWLPAWLDRRLPRIGVERT
jgi:putative drug exporter of the RND superfamily